MDDGPRPVSDAEEQAALRAQARRIRLQSLAATAAVALLYSVIVATW